MVTGIVYPVITNWTEAQYLSECTYVCFPPLLEMAIKTVHSLHCKMCVTINIVLWLNSF